MRYSVNNQLLFLNHLVSFFEGEATSGIYPLSLHDALPISAREGHHAPAAARARADPRDDRVPVQHPDALRLRRELALRSEEHTSELQSPDHLVCRLLLEKKKQTEKNKQEESGRDVRIQYTH